MRLPKIGKLYKVTRLAVTKLITGDIVMPFKIDSTTILDAFGRPFVSAYIDVLVGRVDETGHTSTWTIQFKSDEGDWYQFLTEVGDVRVELEARYHKEFKEIDKLTGGRWVG